MAKLTNLQYLTAASKIAPEFGKVLAKNTRDIFTEAGFEALQNLPGTHDAVTRFYEIALLVGLQKVEHAKFRDPLVDMGVLETFQMSMGAYMQKNRVKRIKNVNPAFLGADGTGLKNGDSVDPYVVRKGQIVTEYFSLNENYQNWFSIQDFDLKLGWTSEYGVDDIVSAMYEMVDLDKIEYRYALFFKVLDGAINSTTYPLKDTQKLTTTWTTGTDAEVKALVELVKDIEESITTVPAIDILNAAGVPNSAPTSDMVMLVRQGYKSKIESAMAYAFGPDYLQFPIKVKSTANFGGLQYFAKTDTSHTTPLQPVADANGVYTGYYSADGSTSNQVAEADLDVVDPNEDIIAVIIEKGAIFELVQNPMKVRSIFNPRGEYVNTFFNQMNNSLNAAHDKNLITISKA